MMNPFIFTLSRMFRVSAHIATMAACYLVGAWTARAGYKRQAKRDAAFHVAKFVASLRDLGSITDRSRRQLPSWCRDPGFDRAHALSEVLRATWPAIRSYLNDAEMLASINKDLQAIDLGTEVISSIKLVCLDVGVEPPVILGMRAASSRASHDEAFRRRRRRGDDDDDTTTTRESTTQASDVLLEIDLRWCPGSEMQLLAAASIALPIMPKTTTTTTTTTTTEREDGFLDITAGIRDVVISSVLQVELTGALPSPPFYTNARIMFREQPHVDFGINIMGAHASLVPFLEDTIVNAVRSALSSYVWPSGFDIELATPLVEPPPPPCISVRLSSITGVPRMDYWSKNDLFAVAQLERIRIDDRYDRKSEGEEEDNQEIHPSSNITAASSDGILGEADDDDDNKKTSKADLDEVVEKQNIKAAMLKTGNAVRMAHKMASLAASSSSSFVTSSRKTKSVAELLASSSDDGVTHLLPFGAEIQCLRPLRISSPSQSLRGSAASTSVKDDDDEPEWSDDEPPLILQLPGQPRLAIDDTKCLDVLQICVCDADLFGSCQIAGFAVLPLSSIRQFIEDQQIYLPVPGDETLIHRVTIDCPLLPPELTEELVHRLNHREEQATTTNRLRSRMTSKRAVERMSSLAPSLPNLHPKKPDHLSSLEHMLSWFRLSSSSSSSPSTKKSHEEEAAATAAQRGEGAMELEKRQALRDGSMVASMRVHVELAVEDS
ncbi:extended synaptotagmin-like protein [Pycnococcus provasolii]|uniref:Extended synaptotagmin-like protein n=2 Tax=Pycnococcus provasolii TaxID=41880 RepID=A0A830HRA6_9CHLO|nr:extended synaptotagmin-like protein [Pycnococcus provasolii]